MKRCTLLSVGFYTGANILDKGISFLIIPLFSRLMTTAEYGTASTFIAAVGIVTIFAGFQSHSSVTTAYGDFVSDLDCYIGALFFLCVCVSVVILVIGIVADGVFFSFQYLPLVMLCVCTAFSYAVINIIGQKYLMQSRHIRRALVTLFPNIVSTLLAAVLMLLLGHHFAEIRMTIYALIPSCVAILFLAVYLPKFRYVGEKQYVRYAISFSAPLVLHGLSNVVLAQSDRIMITTLYSTGDTGMYSLVCSLCNALSLVTLPLSQIWLPWFMKKYENKDFALIRRCEREFILLCAVATIFLTFVLPDVLRIFADKSYWGGESYIVPIVLSQFVIYLYSFCVNLEYKEKATKRIALNTSVAMVANVVLNFLFIPKFGGLAAAYTTLVSYLISFAMHLVTVRRLCPSINSSGVMLLLLFGTALFCGSSLFIIHALFVRYMVLSICLFLYLCYFIKVRGWLYLLLNEKELPYV